MRCAVVAMVLSCVAHGVAAQGDEARPTWQLTGYALSLLTRSTTILPARERYTLDLNRVRLRIDGSPLPNLELQVQYDHEILFGSYLGTSQFALVKDRVSDTSLDLERTYIDDRDILARHGVYRATVSWSARDTDLILGRQRIAWGTGRFWSPMDILNPFDAIRLERDERLGVDAVLVERSLGALGRVNGVFAPATERSRSAVGGYLHGNARGTDYSVMAGNYRDGDVVGADFAGRVGGLGIRGEATATRPDSGRRFVRALLGADYGFPNMLSVTAELYYNGQGTGRRTGYDFAALFEGRIRSVARRYAGVAATYDVTPLLEVFVHGILNVDDRSQFVWPGLEYSLSGNAVITAGVQVFTGGAGSEYGRFRDVLHLQAKWFF